MKKPIFLLIKNSIYPYDILVSVSTYNELIKYIEKDRKYVLSEVEKEKLEMDGVGRTVMLRGGQTIIRLESAKTSLGIDIADLTHEIEHAVFFIFERIGIKHSIDSDEAFAYYQAYIMREVLNYFEKK